MKSVMSHNFSRVPLTEIPRSTFDRGHGLKTAFDSGYLVPVEVQEVLPSDTVNFHGKFLARLAPVVTPVMDSVFLDLQAFFVPSRLLWSNFTKMMGERVNPKDSIDFVVPQLTAPEGGFSIGSLADYFGIPTGVAGINVNALPFRAYAKIWDDWYRDENLQDSVIQSSDDLGDGNGDIAWNTLRRRGKRHDYFTSCLPTPQKGDGVNLPLGGTAPVVGDGKALGLTDGTNNGGLAPSGVNYVGSYAGIYGSDVGSTASGDTLSLTKSLGLTSDGSKSGVVADLSEATAATINSLRMAFQLQRMLEADNRNGTRYCEIIRGHFRTICPDARLQRSEFLGGSSTRIQFTPVAQTSSTDSVSPQGNLAATAQCGAYLSFTKSFTEHGYIIVLANVRCDLNYQQGLGRLWSRRGRYDFFWPTLQHLGEQAVLNKEIYAQGTDEDDEVFGYQERYAEYRYNPSIITGKMRSTASDSLDVWHLAQEFDTLPKLSAEFIEDHPPLDRVLAVTEGQPQILLDAFLGQIWTRPMATYSIPGLVDHL